MNKKFLTILITSLISFNSFSSSIDYKVNVNPLHYAVEINESSYVEDLINDEPNLATQFNKNGLTPLHLAIEKDSLTSLKKILDLKINPNIKNGNGETPLIYAIKNDKAKAVKILLSSGANKKIADYEGNDAAFYAEKSNKEIKELFFEKVMENKQNKENVLNIEKEKEEVKNELSKYIDEKLKESYVKNKEIEKKYEELLLKYNKDKEELQENIRFLEISLVDLENKLEYSLNELNSKSEKDLKVIISKFNEIFSNLKDLKDNQKKAELINYYKGQYTSEDKPEQESYPILNLKNSSNPINEENEDQEINLNLLKGGVEITNQNQNDDLILKINKKEYIIESNN